MTTDNKFDLVNYSRGQNARYVTIGNMQLFFSYRTVIAIKYMNKAGEYVQHGRVNEWGPTTGRHMNDVPGNHKDDRLSGEDFINELEKMFKEVAL
jgi:hypothetical protein